MSTETVIKGALSGLVGNRVYADTFTQTPADPLTMPAIRYTLIGGTTYPSLCGNAAAETDDVRVQIDVITARVAERTTLISSVRAAMDALASTPILQGPPQYAYDAETKAFRATLDYVFHGSSTT